MDMQQPTNRGPLYIFEGVWPKLHESVFIAPTAAVIGNVTIGEQSNIWYHCVLRGDSNFITIGKRVNIQDGTIVHVNAGKEPTIIGDDVTVGHAAIVHACTLMDRAFVGMGATVLDGAVIEEGGVIAAGSVLPPRHQRDRGRFCGPHASTWISGRHGRPFLCLSEESAACHWQQVAPRRAGTP